MHGKFQKMFVKGKRLPQSGGLGTGILVGLLLTGFILAGVPVCASEGSGDKITLRLLHYWGDTDTDISASYLKEILDEEFAEVFPDVELIQETCDNETYKDKFKVQMASGEEADILFSYGGGFMQNYVQAGKLLVLDDYLEDFYLEQMDMDAQENFVFDGELYGVCCSTWKGVLYCNTALFEKAGAEIPQTYEELLEACRLLREADVEPIALGMLNKWQGQQWVNNLVIQLGGASLYKDMALGKESMDNEVMEEAVRLIENLIENDVFAENMYQMVSGEAEELFLNGGAAMIYIGSWFTEQALESLGDDLAVAKMPEVPGAEYTKDYHGGGANGWVVSADTEYPETAVNIAAWLSYRLSCYQPENTAFAIAEGDAVSPVSAVGQEIQELYQDAGEGGSAWDTLMSPDRADTWLDLCAKLFGGEADTQEFMRELVEELG